LPEVGAQALSIWASSLVSWMIRDGWCSRRVRDEGPADGLRRRSSPTALACTVPAPRNGSKPRAPPTATTSPSANDTELGAAPRGRDRAPPSLHRFTFRLAR
jgi:hypothetical protein